MIKFFEELNFFVFIHKFWEKCHVISQVINHIQESSTISINENFLTDHLFSDVIIVEKSMKMRTWNIAENIFLGKKMMSTTNVKSYDF